jgi:hypothetical protein
MEQVEMERAPERTTRLTSERGDFDVRDCVMTTTKDWQLGCPTRKLVGQAAGRYKIIVKAGHSYRLYLGSLE